MSTDALHLVMASKAFTAVPRAVIGMARDDKADVENTVVLSQIKSNLGPLDEARRLSDIGGDIMSVQIGKRVIRAGFVV
jgi:hypothetical protein